MWLGLNLRDRAFAVRKPRFRASNVGSNLSRFLARLFDIGIGSNQGMVDSKIAEKVMRSLLFV